MTPPPSAQVEASEAEPWTVRSRAGRVVVTLAAAGVVVAIRGVLDPILGDRLPYVLFAIASVMVTWVAGAWSGASLLVAGWLLGNLLWVRPRGVLVAWKGASDLTQTVIFFAACALPRAPAQAMASRSLRDAVLRDRVVMPAAEKARDKFIESSV